MIIPARDYILITVEDKAEERTESGIYLPEKQADAPQCGTVAVEKDIQDKDGEYYDTFKVGTKVFFKMWAGTPINYEGVDYLLVHIKDVVAFEQGGEA